jgi:hypothetical protein
MSLSKTAWIAISGIIWFVVGIGLLTLGMNFIVSTAQAPVQDAHSIMSWLSSFSGGSEQAALVLITMGLIAGFMKGRFVLVKTTKRVISRILALKDPVSFSQVYSKGYFFLIGGMVLLGMSMKWIHFPVELRGFVDVAVGSALMNGASAYFRAALSVRRELKKP